MDKKVLAIVIAVLMVALVTATVVLFLFPYQPTQPPKTDDVGSTPQGIQEVVDANNEFAFDLYTTLVKSQVGNMFYSPYSISAALAMTYEGAKGQTAHEMKSVFHFPENDVLRTNFAAIYNGINKGDKAYKLSTGNALWVQKDYPILEEYKLRVEKYYGGKAADLDFVAQAEKSRQTINKFIEEQTEDKIKDLIPQGALNAYTRLVLTNAIYFKGTWEWEFDVSNTHEQNFRITPTNIVKTQMMFMKNDKATFNYADAGDLQILELPYKGEEISMLILLPTENLDALAHALTLENLNAWKSQMKGNKLDAIYLPKFEFDAKYFMKDTLSSLGMPTAFSPQSADFSGIDGSRNLFIDAVIHQAYVKVDEEGTEAAAATAVIVGTTSAGPPRKEFRADHPFIFIIQEKETGNILFLGRVNDPNKK